MARQSTTPVQFNRTVRPDTSITMTSARAGKIVPVGYIPLLRGDGCAGRVGFDLKLKEMPKPLLNAVVANFQAWFVPKSAHPQFSGIDELNHAYTGEVIHALGSSDRSPPQFFSSSGVGASRTTAVASKFLKTLGLHVPAGYPINSDLIDAFNVIVNFRRAAVSSRLPVRKYFSQDAAAATSLPRAFWPSQRFAQIVPDYESALVVGSLDLDVLAGRLPISGLGVWGSNATTPATNVVARETGSVVDTTFPKSEGFDGAAVFIGRVTGATAAAARADIWAEMAGQQVSVTLADIDKARVTQAFAKLRTAYAGNDATGFDNDDTIIALLMQGIPVPADQFKRPWLLDAKRVPVGFAERFASDAANLDESVTLGGASCVLSLNVPAQEVSGVIIFTVEVMPERLDERMGDSWLLATTVNELPNALRDVQRVEPVDQVENWRVDTAHANPSWLYGYEPMNMCWGSRDFTRLGGDFYQATPGAGWTQNRSAIWQSEIVNPSLSVNHYLAPTDFPHDVFSDTAADAFEIVVRHAVRISGLTQIGDPLAESNNDFNTVEGTGL